MLAGATYARFLCDVCSKQIGRRGFVVVKRGFVVIAKCRAHREARLPGQMK